MFHKLSVVYFAALVAFAVSLPSREFYEPAVIPAIKESRPDLEVDTINQVNVDVSTNDNVALDGDAVQATTSLDGRPFELEDGLSYNGLPWGSLYGGRLNWGGLGLRGLGWNGLTAGLPLARRRGLGLGLWPQDFDIDTINQVDVDVIRNYNLALNGDAVQATTGLDGRPFLLEDGLSYNGLPWGSLYGGQLNWGGLGLRGLGWNGLAGLPLTRRGGLGLGLWPQGGLRGLGLGSLALDGLAGFPLGDFALHGGALPTFYSTVSRPYGSYIKAGY